MHAVIAVALSALSLLAGVPALAGTTDYRDSSPGSMYEAPRGGGEKCHAGRIECWRRDVKRYDSQVLRLILTGTLDPKAKPRLGGYAKPDPRRRISPRVSPEEDAALRNLAKPLYRPGMFKPCDSCGPDYPKTKAAVLVLPDGPPETIVAAWRSFKTFREGRSEAMDFKIFLWTRNVREALSSLKSPEARSMFGRIHRVPIVIKRKCPVCDGLDRRKLPAVVFLSNGARARVAYWPFDLERDGGGESRR